MCVPSPPTRALLHQLRRTDRQGRCGELWKEGAWFWPRALFMRFGLRLLPTFRGEERREANGLVAAKIWSTFAVGVKDFSLVVRRRIFNFELHLIYMQFKPILDDLERVATAWKQRYQRGYMTGKMEWSSGGVGSWAKLSTSWLIGRYRLFGWLGSEVRSA